MRLLVTGIGGFVGRHFAAQWASAEHGEKQVAHSAVHNGASAMPAFDGLELHGVVMQPPERPIPANPTLHTLDLRDDTAVLDLLDQVRPDAILHLAAWAEVGASFNRPWTTIENNVHSQVNLLAGCIKLNLRPRTLVVTSGEIYGGCPPDGSANSEDDPFRPANPYSVSKVTQDMLALQYHLSHQLPIVRARPFNHIGPGQNTGFVAPDFAMQIARIEAGLAEPVIRVGDLSAERDFTDVRDIVRAYRLLLEHGQPGEAYNVASGHTVPIQRILDLLLRFSSVPIMVERDPARARPGGVRRSCGDITRLKRATGWQSIIALEATLSDVLDDCRARVQAEQDDDTAPVAPALSGTKQSTTTA